MILKDIFYNKTSQKTTVIPQKIVIQNELKKNQLFIRDSYAQIKVLKKIKKSSAKFHFLRYIQFVLTIQFVVAFAFDRVALYGNVAPSLLVL